MSIRLGHLGLFFVSIRVSNFFSSLRFNFFNKIPHNTIQEKSQDPTNWKKQIAPPPHPPVNISPGEGLLAEPGVFPPVAFAKVLGRRQKPKVLIPEEVIESHPEFKYNDTEEDNTNQK